MTSTKTFKESILQEYKKHIPYLKKNDFVDKVRQISFDNFKACDLPTNKLELFSYVDFNDIFNKSYKFVYNFDDNLPVINIHDENNIESDVIVLVNGVYHASYSKYDKKEKTISLCGDATLSKELENDIINDFLNEKDIFAIIPGLFINNPNVIKISGELQRPLEIIEYFYNVNNSENDFSIFSPFTIIELENNSKAEIMHKTIGIGNYCISNSMKLFIKKQAKLNYIKLQCDSNNLFYNSKVNITQNDNSTVKALSISRGGDLVRHNFDVKLEKDVNFEFKVLNVLNKNEKSHYYINVNHKTTGAISTQSFRNVLMDNAHTSVDTTVLVDKGAVNIDSKQMVNNLILSDKARSDIKPNLRIYADDVKCAHGATIGKLNKKEILYLMSRGIDINTAKKLLIEGFVNAMIYDIDRKDALSDISKYIMCKL